MTALEKKAFISSDLITVLSSCPPPCGHFSIQESAAGGLSYKARKAGVQNTPAFKHHRKRHLLHRLRPVFLRQHYLYQVLRVKTVRFTLRPPRPPHFQKCSIYMILTAYSALQILRIASAKIFALRSSISISMNSSSPCM